MSAAKNRVHVLRSEAVKGDNALLDDVTVELVEEEHGSRWVYITAGCAELGLTLREARELQCAVARVLEGA